MMVKASCMLVLVLALVSLSAVRAKTESFEGGCIKRYSDNDGGWPETDILLQGDGNTTCTDTSAEFTVGGSTRASVELLLEAPQNQIDKHLNVTYYFGDCMMNVQYRDEGHTNVFFPGLNPNKTYEVRYPTWVYLVPEGGQTSSYGEQFKNLAQGLYVWVRPNAYLKVTCSPFTDSTDNCMDKPCTFQFSQTVAPGNGVHYKLGIVKASDVKIEEWKPTTTALPTTETSSTIPEDSTTEEWITDAEGSTIAEKKKVNYLLWIIIGGVILALVVGAIIVSVLLLLCRRKKEQHGDDFNEADAAKTQTNSKRMEVSGMGTVTSEVGETVEQGIVVKSDEPVTAK